MGVLSRVQMQCNRLSSMKMYQMKQLDGAPRGVQPDSVSQRDLAIHGHVRGVDGSGNGGLVMDGPAMPTNYPTLIGVLDRMF